LPTTVYHGADGTISRGDPGPSGDAAKKVIEKILLTQLDGLVGYRAGDQRCKPFTNWDSASPLICARQYQRLRTIERAYINVRAAADARRRRRQPPAGTFVGPTFNLSLQLRTRPAGHSRDHHYASRLLRRGDFVEWSQVGFRRCGSGEGPPNESTLPRDLPRQRGRHAHPLKFRLALLDAARRTPMGFCEVTLRPLLVPTSNGLPARHANSGCWPAS